MSGIGRFLWLVLFFLVAAGCHGTYRTPTMQPAGALEGLSLPMAMPVVEAIAAPPAHWRADPPKMTGRHQHQVWLSPTGKTAYGIIHIHLPLPVGADMALWGFMQQMRKEEGESTLISREADPHLPGVRFVAEGGRYRIRVNLIVRGWKAWAIYAGTLRGQTEIPAELELAERARDATITGLPRASRSSSHDPGNASR